MTDKIRTKSIWIVGLRLLCPKCGEGKLFTNPNPYNFKTIADMPGHCPKCNLSFMPEPGFYYGAMFMSYVVTVALSVLNFLWVYAIWGWATWTYLILNTIILILLLPYLFRASRSFYLAVVYRFEKATDKKMND
jgi:uncharacterized protein (DUF983 family)